jgi:hypothetical protein
MGTATQPLTGVPPWVAGTKLQCFTASSAASSSAERPLVRCTSTVPGLPLGLTSTRSNVVPSQPCRRARLGYAGRGLFA